MRGAITPRACSTTTTYPSPCSSVPTRISSSTTRTPPRIPSSPPRASSTRRPRSPCPSRGPPLRWFHQHFNVADKPGRYLAFHAPRGVMQSERVEDRARDQIEYPNEDLIVRQRFEEELAKHGLKSLMPEQAYRDPNYEWDYK